VKRVHRLTLLALLLLGAATHASGAARAWLDRDHIVVGDSVTLTIQSDESSGKPDLASLGKDFDTRGVATSSQTTIVNGSMKSSMQWAVTLTPRHSGVIDIPALPVGGERTLPLRVGVDPGPSAGAGSQVSAQPTSHTNASEPVFIESSIDPPNPYVQQATIYTVRLYYAVALLDAALNVSPSDHGDLRQIGEDERNSVIVQGHRYDVLVRHYLLQPESSGMLHIPAPVFQGRTMPNVDDMFDDTTAGNPGNLRTAGKQLDVQVRARPRQSRDPWLPARAVQLSVDPPTTPLHANEPFSIVVKIEGEGVTAAQLPEITLPTIPGTQVYPEPSTTADHARDGSLVAERTRRFAIVSDHPGDLQLPALEVPWWDIGNDRAAVARVALPKLTLLPGAATVTDAANGASPASGDASSTSVALPSLAGTAAVVRGWQLAALSLGVLLVASLWWGWQRASVGRGSTERGIDADADDGVARAPNRAPTLSRALALGELSAIAQALIEAAPVTPRNPAPRSLADVAQRLDDPAQRAAVLAIDAARWSAACAPPEQALAQLRSAFAKPPRWAGRNRPPQNDNALPPLYPS
jgi:hypothetical protein